MHELFFPRVYSPTLLWQISTYPRFPRLLEIEQKRPPRAGVAESSAGASLAESDRSSSPRESVVLLANGVVDEAMEPVDEDEDEDEGDELSLEEEFGEDIFALEDYA